MILGIDKIPGAVFKYLKDRHDKQKQTLEHVKELNSQVGLLTNRIEGELSFAKSIVKHDKEIAVLEGGMKFMQSQVDNIQQTVSNVNESTGIMFKIIDRKFGREGKPDTRGERKERRAST